MRSSIRQSKLSDAQMHLQSRDCVYNTTGTMGCTSPKVGAGITHLHDLGNMCQTGQNRSIRAETSIVLRRRRISSFAPPPPTPGVCAVLVLVLWRYQYVCDVVGVKGFQPVGTRAIECSHPSFRERSAARQRLLMPEIHFPRAQCFSHRHPQHNKVSTDNPPPCCASTWWNATTHPAYRRTHGRKQDGNNRAWA